MKIIPKELVSLNKLDEITFQNSDILKRLNEKTGYKMHFELSCDESGYYISNNIGNEILFETAEVKKYKFQDDVLGYSEEFGNFPYCKTSDDAIKLFNAILILVIYKK